MNPAPILTLIALLLVLRVVVRHFRGVNEFAVGGGVKNMPDRSRAADSASVERPAHAHSNPFRPAVFSNALLVEQQRSIKLVPSGWAISPKPREAM